MTADPRPLRGEPLALDLVNTEWIDHEGHHDLLLDADGLAVWLRSLGRAAPGDAAMLPALRAARAAIRGVIELPGNDGARAALNAVLARGAWAERLGPHGPERITALRDTRWALPWEAAANLLDLLRDDPDRVRRCAGHECLLAFYDSSQSGRRQWCSMAICGNRAKARRHYERSRTSIGLDCVGG
jgi:predicted RNA-binding Zn ribbon-like protein